MIDIKTLSNDQKLILLRQLEEHFGWYPIVTLTIEDVRERFRDDETMPPNRILHTACKYVMRKNDEESTHLIDWAQEIAQEILDDTEQKETA